MCGQFVHGWLFILHVQCSGELLSLWRDKHRRPWTFAGGCVLGLIITVNIFKSRELKTHCRWLGTFGASCGQHFFYLVIIWVFDMQWLQPCALRKILQVRGQGRCGNLSRGVLGAGPNFHLFGTGQCGFCLGWVGLSVFIATVISDFLLNVVSSMHQWTENCMYTPYNEWWYHHHPIHIPFLFGPLQVCNLCGRWQ